MISRLFYSIIKHTLGELAKNPELQARTAKVVKERVFPGVRAGWKKAKPKLEEGKAAAKNATNKVAEVARENNPRKDPKKFLSEAVKRLRDR